MILDRCTETYARVCVCPVKLEYVRYHANFCLIFVLVSVYLQHSFQIALTSLSIAILRFLAYLLSIFNVVIIKVFSPIIIENLWAVLKKKVAKHVPTSSDELWRITEQEWHRINNDVIVRLYESMPQRIKLALDCKDLNIKY